MKKIVIIKRIKSKKAKCNYQAWLDFIKSQSISIELIIEDHSFLDNTTPYGNVILFWEFTVKEIENATSDSDSPFVVERICNFIDKIQSKNLIIVFDKSSDYIFNQISHKIPKTYRIIFCNEIKKNDYKYVSFSNEKIRNQAEDSGELDVRHFFVNHMENYFE